MRRCLTFFALASMGAAANADSIFYRIEGNFVGTVAGTATNAPFSIWAVGDTSGIHQVPGISPYVVYTNNDLIVNVKIGSHSGTVNGLGRFFVNNTVKAAGFSETGDFGPDYWNVLSNNLATYDPNYDLITTNVVASFGSTFETSFGTVGFSYFTPTKLTIDVNPVPEPASLAALGAGMLALARRRRR